MQHTETETRAPLAVQSSRTCLQDKSMQLFTLMSNVLNVLNMCVHAIILLVSSFQICTSAFFRSRSRGFDFIHIIYYVAMNYFKIVVHVVCLRHVPECWLLLISLPLKTTIQKRNVFWNSFSHSTLFF